MIKMIAAVCRRPGMTHAEYIAYIQRVHAEIARAEPLTLKRYVQNHVFDAAFGTRADASHSMVVSRDSVTELFWDTFEAMGATFAHPYTQQKVGPDGANFADLRMTLSMIADEVELAVPAPGPGDAKAMLFLKKVPELSLDTFFERWTHAHEQVMRDEPLVAAALRRATQNRQNPKGDAMLKYFGGAEDDRFAGIASLWFDDVASVGLFRRYEARLLEENAKNGQSFYVPAASFFVYAREVCIM